VNHRKISPLCARGLCFTREGVRAQTGKKNLTPTQREGGVPAARDRFTVFDLVVIWCVVF